VGYMNEVIKAVDLTKIYNKEDKKKKEKISESSLKWCQFRGISWGLY